MLIQYRKIFGTIIYYLTINIIISNIIISNIIISIIINIYTMCDGYK